MLGLTLTDFGKTPENERYLKITIPESLNYDEAFDDLLNTYTSKWELDSIKTLNLGSLFRLEYSITMKNGQVVHNVDELQTGDELETRLANGTVHSIVTNKL